MGLSTLQLYSYAQKPVDRLKPQDKPLNVGFKIGLNALSSTNFEAFLGDIPLTNSYQANKSGYGLNGFFRINLDHFFMQPEVEWNLYKQKYFFSLPSIGDDENEVNYSIKHRFQSGGINILVGYNIIKNGPYVFNAYIGPSFKYTYSSKYESPDNVFYNYNAKYNSFGIAGLSFSILKFFVDIRYEISITNTDIDFNEISNTPGIIKNLVFEKNENKLNFSCGVFF